MPNAPDETWTEERFHQALTSYCFDNLTDHEREAVERHLLHCDECWSAFQRLDAAVRILRFSPEFKPDFSANEAVSLLGLSSRLERSFAGHAAFALIASTMFAFLFAVPVIVEIAYEFDRYGQTALQLAAAAFTWMFGVSLFGLWLGTKATKDTGSGIGRSMIVWLGGTVVLCVVLWPFLPSSPTVQADFQTWPASLGYLKSVVYAWMVGPIFVVWPLHFVVALQRDLLFERHRNVINLLTHRPEGLSPRGIPYPPMRVLALYWLGLFAFNLVGMTNLFENLVSGTYMNLFMGLVLARVIVWLGLPFACMWWYRNRLEDLKREAYGRELVSGRSSGSRSV